MFLPVSPRVRRQLAAFLLVHESVVDSPCRRSVGAAENDVMEAGGVMHTGDPGTHVRGAIQVVTVEFSHFALVYTIAFPLHEYFGMQVIGTHVPPWNTYPGEQEVETQTPLFS